MQSHPFERFIVGVMLAIFGLALIVFHKPIKEWRDDWSSKDFPMGYGEMWSGKYSRGGLILTYALIIIVGVVFLAAGIFRIVSAFRG